MNVVAGSRQGVAPRPAQSAGESAHDGGAGVQGAQYLEQRAHEFDQIPFDLDLAGAIGVPELNLRIDEQPEQGAAVRDPHVFRGRYPDRRHTFAAPAEVEFDGWITELAQQAAQQTRLDRRAI